VRSFPISRAENPDEETQWHSFRRRNVQHASTTNKYVYNNRGLWRAGLRDVVANEYPIERRDRTSLFRKEARQRTGGIDGVNILIAA